MRVTDAEVAKLKLDAAARDMSVSEHIRELIRAFGLVKPVVAALREKIPELTVAAELPARGLDGLPILGDKSVPTRTRVKTCVHGTERDWHCWQCGGKAKIEQ